MKKSEWLGRENTSPAVWIGPDGKGHISELAFNSTDDEGRQALLQHASELEAQFEVLCSASPPPPCGAAIAEALALKVSPTPGEALGAAADNLIFALMEFVQIVRTVRDDGTSERDADVRYTLRRCEPEEE